MESSNAVAYADPRGAGAVRVRVFWKPLAEEVTYWEQRSVPSRDFTIPDARKHGLKDLVEKALADAVREMSPGLRAVSTVA
jgi:hypothetical protein